MSRLWEFGPGVCNLQRGSAREVRWKGVLRLDRNAVRICLPGMTELVFQQSNGRE